MIKVRFLIDYPGYPVGSEATVSADGAGLPPGVASELQRRGIVKSQANKPLRRPKQGRKLAKG